MTAPQSPLQDATTRLVNRLTGLALRMIGYGADPFRPPVADVAVQSPRKARMSAEPHVRSIGCED